MQVFKRGFIRHLFFKNSSHRRLALVIGQPRFNVASCQIKRKQFKSQYPANIGAVTAEAKPQNYTKPKKKHAVEELECGQGGGMRQGGCGFFRLFPG